MQSSVKRSLLGSSVRIVRRLFSEEAFVKSKNDVSAAEAVGGFPPNRGHGSLQRLFSSCQSCHDRIHTAATSTVSSCCWARSSSLAQDPGPPRPFFVTILRLWYFNFSPDVFSAPDIFFSCPDVFVPPLRPFIHCLGLGFNTFYLTRLTILRPVY